MRFLNFKIIWIILIIVAAIIHKSTFAQWQYSHYDIYPDQMFDCAAVDSNIFWAVGSFGYVIKSTDSGRTWSPFSYAHLTDNLRKVDFPDPVHGFAASQTGVTVIASNDSGSNWQIVSQNLLLNRISGMKFADSLNGYISGANTIYRTTDGGNSWITPDSFIPSFSTNDLLINNKDTAWACGQTGDDPYLPMIIKTTDGGHHWNSVTTLGDTLDGHIRAISFADLNHGWAIMTLTHSYLGFLYSTLDGGMNWSLIYTFNDGPSAHDLNNVVALDSLNLRIAGDTYIGGNIRRSTDGGYNWYFEWNGYAGAIRGFSMPDSSHGLVVGGPIGDNTPLILYYDQDVGIDDNTKPLPKSFQASDAYPNPFNSSTTISLSVPISTFISIYDITGRKVASLSLREGSGIWDASPYKSGIYFARVENKKTPSVIKLIYVK